MSQIFLAPMSQEILEDDGFSDGQNITVPDNTVLNCVVIGGFIGIEEGKSQQVCMINISITSPGEFFGQKYKYNAKIYDMDANKRDLALTNLGKLDAQAGFPMTNGRLEMTTDNVESCWVGVSEAQVKIGLFLSTEDMNGNAKEDANGNPVVDEINFIRGFAYLREKMVQAGGAKQAQQPQRQAQDMTNQLDDADQPQDSDDIGF